MPSTVTAQEINRMPTNQSTGASPTGAKFITFEGIEGAGKSTHMQWVSSWLNQQKLSFVLTREPGGTPMAEALRGILLTEYAEPTQADTELLLLYAGRVQHIQTVIKPALAQGKWVLCDRFSDATFAYQGGGRGVSFERINTLNHWALGDFKPDVTFLFDAPVEIGLARIQKRKSLDRIEKEKQAFFENIRKSYLQRAQDEPNRFIVIDANRPVDIVQNELAQHLLKIKEQTFA